MEWQAGGQQEEPANRQMIGLQARLRRLIDDLPGIVFACDNAPGWPIIYLSRGCRLLTGYDPEDLIGSQRQISYSDLIHPEDLPELRATLDQAIAHGQPYWAEYRIHSRSGQEKWLWEKGHGVYNDAGQLLGLEGFITDITDRKRVEEALQAKEVFLQLVLDNIPQYIFWKDRNSVYLGCNRRWAEMAGIGEPEDVVGLTDAELPWLPEETAWYLACDRLVMETDTPMLRVTESQRQADGKQTWRETNKIPIHDRRGTVIGLLGTFEDITDRQQAEAALRAAEEKYRGIFENSVEGIFQTTADGRYVTANPMLAHIYGYDSPQELMACLTDIEHQLYVDPQRRVEFRRRVQEEGTVWEFESQVYRRDGSIIWISENARTLRNDEGQILGYEGTVSDITQRKQAEAEIYKRDALLQGVADATKQLLTNPNYEEAINTALAILGQVVGVDRAYIYQNHPHSLNGDMAMSICYEWTRPTVTPSMGQAHWHSQPYQAFGLGRWYDLLSSGQSVSGIVREFPAAEQEILKWDGILSIMMVPILIDEEFWGYVGFDDCHSERQWFSSEESILQAMAASFGGALKRQQAEATIRYQAFHDLLTGLPNRTLFNDRLLLALANAQRMNSLLAVMFLDLDRFKTINDTLGHAVGDQLLQAVVERLGECLREGDTAARWGGDEFTLLLPQISCAEDAARVAQRILETLQPGFSLEGYELYVTSSIGIALYPFDGEDVQTLLKNADAALYRAKEQGRNNYQIYTPAINSKATELLALENNLHHALERGEFVIYYQPQVNTTTGEITRMEALVRWHHPVLGSVSPRLFIPLAEENGLIVPIGEWVLQTACAQNKVWQEAGLLPIRVAVNLSARQFQQHRLVEMIAQVLAHTRLEARFLELEVTETTAMQNVDFTTAMLQDLHQMGVRLSLDDFGTGYSSLAYLKRFPLHALKIDQSFVRDLTTDPYDAAIVAAVIALGRGLDLGVIAEGVETVEQLEHLRSLNCEEMQGYLFSQAMPPEEATQFLQKYQMQAWFGQERSDR